MILKTCIKCKKELDIFNFYKCKNYYQSSCKLCFKIYKKNYTELNVDLNKKHQKTYREKNKEKIKKYRDEYVLKNYEKVKEAKKNYILNNKEKYKQIIKEYKQKNKHAILYNTQYSKARKLKRTPKWLSKNDIWLIKEIYDLSRLRTKLFGFKWNVDHIIPMNGKNVSGLHVPQNLRVIPEFLNLKKSNKFLESEL
jgi:16S rRNA C1402 (ribose-2'-O) methylase RsmI